MYFNYLIMVNSVSFDKLLQQQISQIKREGKIVYRYMNDEKYTDLFAEGEIRLSTLKACRGYENPERGDKDEAHETYEVTHMTDRDPNFYSKSRRLGFHIGRSFGSVFKNCSSKSVLPNGFVLCTTARRDDEKFMKDFGEFCVKIKDIDLFYHLITLEIQKQYSLRAGHHQKVIYSNQKYKDDELPAGKIGFVKKEKFKWQEEYRFLWLPKDFNDCQIIDINIPAIKDLCERVL